MLGFACASFRRPCLVLWLFTSCVWDVLWYRILIKKQLLIFSETWCSSFWIVCNCFDDFRTNRPKNNGRSHRKENTNFPKWRWVRSKNVCSSSALLFSLVVIKKYVLRTSWGLSTWNNTCFLSKCRVTFRLRQFSKARFGTLARYFLRLRCLVLSNTCKNSFCFLSKTETFQNDVEYVPEMFFWALLGWILWLWIKKLLWELAEISLHETIRVFCSNAESRFGCAIFRTLRSVLWLFTSCVWDVLRYRILIKKQLLIFSETWSSRFWIVCNCFDDFRKNRPKNNGRSHRKENTNFPKWRWVRFKNVCLSCALLFSLVVTKICFEVSLLGTIRVFCSNAESRSGCAIFRTLRSVLWLFTSCVWDVLWYRILIKTAFLSWAKVKLSKTTLSTFQKCLFELCWACFFGGH